MRTIREQDLAAFNSLLQQQGIGHIVTNAGER